MNLQNQEIVQAVYEEQWINTNDVARATRFSYDSVVVHLRQLREDNILDCRKAGHAKEYRVAASSLPDVVSDKGGGSVGA